MTKSFKTHPLGVGPATVLQLQSWCRDAKVASSHPSFQGT